MSTVSQDWNELKVFIVVKTYPTASKKYQETVCTAGIDEQGRWIRLYPVRYRFLGDDQQYPKYAWIRVVACRNYQDFRPESYRVDNDSITVLQKVDTSKRWAERNRIILPTLSPSIEYLSDQYNRSHVSLGIVRPRRVEDVVCELEEDSPRARKNMFLQQLSLFDEKIPKDLEPVPYRFSYQFFCEDTRCPGHKMIILDWEIFAAYFNWKKKYGEEGAIKRIREKWLHELCGEDRDTYFVVGTNYPHPTFMVLGVYWPPKSDTVQLSLPGLSLA